MRQPISEELHIACQSSIFPLDRETLILVAGTREVRLVISNYGSAFIPSEYI